MCANFASPVKGWGRLGAHFERCGLVCPLPLHPTAKTSDGSARPSRVGKGRRKHRDPPQSSTYRAVLSKVPVQSSPPVTAGFSAATQTPCAGLIALPIGAGPTEHSCCLRNLLLLLSCCTLLFYTTAAVHYCRSPTAVHYYTFTINRLFCVFLPQARFRRKWANVRTSYCRTV